MNGKPLAKPPTLSGERPHRGKPTGHISSDSEVKCSDLSDSQWESGSDIPGSGSFKFSDEESDQDPLDTFSESSKSDSDFPVGQPLIEEDQLGLIKPQNLFKRYERIERRYYNVVSPHYLSYLDYKSIRQKKGFANGKCSLPLVRDGYIVVAHRDSIAFHNMRVRFKDWACEILAQLNLSLSIEDKELLLFINRLNYQYLSSRRETRSFRFIKASLHRCLRHLGQNT